jgi:hypothetical protein
MAHSVRPKAVLFSWTYTANELSKKAQVPENRMPAHFYVLIQKKALCGSFQKSPPRQTYDDLM